MKGRISPEVAELTTVEAFLKGVSETEAAFSVMQNDPSTVDESLELLKKAIDSHKSLGWKFCNTHRTARTVSLAPNPLTSGVQTAQVISNPTQQDLGQQFGSELKDLWSLVAETHEDINKILELLSQQERDSFL